MYLAARKAVSLFDIDPPLPYLQYMTNPPILSGIGILGCTLPRLGDPTYSELGACCSPAPRRRSIPTRYQSECCMCILPMDWITIIVTAVLVVGPTTGLHLPSGPQHVLMCLTRHKHTIL